ncbi:MAG: hypothetical protein NC430_03545 [bacterium]|nr:hypothetical protein [bacterium]
MKTYLLEYNGEIFTPGFKVNNRGFYREEIEKIMQSENYKNYSIICVEDEIIKYHLCDVASNCWELEEEVFRYKLWYDAYLDNNLNGFSLPIRVNTNDEYRSKLEQKLWEYVEYLNRPAFVYEAGLLGDIKIECKLILDALDNLINGREHIAETVMTQMLELFIGDSFLVSDLDKSYSFRGIAPFVDLRHEGYDKY